MSNHKDFYYIGKVYQKRIDGIYDKWKVLDIMDETQKDIEFIVQSFGGVYKAVKKDELLNND